MDQKVNHWYFEFSLTSSDHHETWQLIALSKHKTVCSIRPQKAPPFRNKFVILRGIICMDIFHYETIIAQRTLGSASKLIIKYLNKLIKSNHPHQPDSPHSSPLNRSGLVSQLIKILTRVENDRTLVWYVGILVIFFIHVFLSSVPWLWLSRGGEGYHMGFWDHGINSLTSFSDIATNFVQYEYYSHRSLLIWSCVASYSLLTNN